MSEIRKFEFWSVIVLEILFGLCATSVVLYQVTGRFDFGFGFLSYRFFNIAVSIVLIGWLIYGWVKGREYILVYIGVFSLFHFVEGLVIQFSFKVVIHLLILVLVGKIYLRNRTLKKLSTAVSDENEATRGPASTPSIL